MARRQALVIGATGGVGGATADRLLADGWRVRALNRNPETAAQRSGRGGLEWVAGDAMVAADVATAAEGCDIIVHGANPPGYRNWAGLQLPMLASTIAAAKAGGARVLFPGTVYNYGEDAFPRIDERSEQHPATRKGRIRVAMEALLRGSGVPVLILRTGDFFGPRPGNNWMSQGLVRPGRPPTSVMYPGPLDVPHAWAYLPDVAETFVRLLATDLAAFDVFQMQGQEVDGHQLVAGLEAAVGGPVAVRRLPWLGLHMAAPFNESLREMLEMRYLWERPVLLDNRRLVAKLGAEPRTSLAEALRAALAGQGSLPATVRAAA
ncbi:MAG: NAD(P)H-binding protein [Phenylobacterium sp.]|uniref:NAD(P)H-binding protein n=1 Tax=Phenylobacterium sp. TaxID=1871053 RepID=UPI001A36405D|nr:NAD(P)H-binding protein [Phenylobacterium sp.]MBL8555203.1 NAD(P)H-binding protein [Phenylobacterium sp.]